MKARQSAKTSFITKASKLAVFALLFTLVLGITLSAILYSDVNNLSGSQTADATAGKYYSFDSNKRIIISAAALDGTTFSLDETYGPYSTDTEKEAVRSYWTQVNCSKQDILGYDSTPVDSDGYGMKTKSDNVKDGYNTLSTYAYLSIVPEDGLTITKITVTTTYLYAKTSGSNGWSSADHSTKTTLSIVSGDSSVEVASVTASTNGNRSTTEKNEDTNSKSLSTSVNKNGVIQIRLTGTYYKEKGSSAVNQVTHVAQGKNISISIEGTYSLPGDGTEANPYKLRNRSDFDFLSNAIATSNSSFISAVYSVEPNTANGQTAYSAGGTEIKMLGTEFTPIGGISGSTTYQFKGSINLL